MTASPLPRGFRRMALTVCAMAATIMQALDSTIANVALPYMQGSLSASQDQINWVLTSYILAAAIATAPIAWLTGRLGRKRLFITCVAGFTVASVLCASAQTIEQMVLYRALQGIFGAALVPLSQSVLLDSYSLAERGSAMAIWGVGVMLGPIMGPTLGGWLTDQYSWHWVFLINLPIGVVTVAGMVLVMDETPINRSRRFDWLGFITLAVGVGALQIMLDRGEEVGWFSSNEIVAELIISIVGLYFFLAHSMTTSNPFVRFEIFRDRNFVTGVTFMAFIGVALFGTMALVSPFMQNVIGYPITTAGWLLGTRGIGTLVAMLVVGRLLQMVEARWLLLAGLVLMAGTMYEMELYTDQTPGWVIIVMSVLQGFGIGLLFVPLSTVAFLTLGSELRTDGAAMLTLIRNIFSSIGISVMIAQLSDNTTIMHARLTEYVTPFNGPLQMPDASMFNVATDAGRALLDAIVTQQAVIIAYGNDYKMLLVLSVLAMPLVLFVGSSAAVRRLAKGPQGDAHAAMD
jgi:MFS transporter, DHA2 family, multidrug resistance protein